MYGDERTEIVADKTFLRPNTLNQGIKVSQTVEITEQFSLHLRVVCVVRVRDCMEPTFKLLAKRRVLC